MLQVDEIDFHSINLRVEAFFIRTQVFIFEQGVDPSLEYDEFDETAHHYLAFDGNMAVGTARWRTTGEGIKLERFAVLQAFRNKGVGAALLQKIMEDVVPQAQNIYLHAQLKAVPFYEKHGFVKEGNVFLEAGINHYAMTWSGK